MRKFGWNSMLAVVLFMSSPVGLRAGDAPHPRFQTSDRCLACHNQLTTPSGKDVSIGFDWRSSIMANSSRDPYWQASVRRETLDHPESRSAIEDECSICHMPMARYEAKLQRRQGQIFSHLPFDSHDDEESMHAEDGVSCSVCHQIGPEKLGSAESFNGGFVVNQPKSKNDHPEYGPFAIANGHQHIMDTSTGGFLPTEAAHIRDSALCGSCHTLLTKALSPEGKEIGSLPEQTPYQEWLHSSYRDHTSCQDCHMPAVEEETPIAAVLGVPRKGLHEHTFVAGNFVILRMLNLHRQDLSVGALPQELTAASERTVEFLQSQAARISIPGIELASGKLKVEVQVVNLTGHKLPTAYPSRRAWVHFIVQDQSGGTVFESGALNADGSIQGNDNDADASRYEPHYREITRDDQVQIFESIMQDHEGHVTTGLLSAVRYVKDNRLLPQGFQKQTAETDIAVVGDAAGDPNFTEAGDRLRYSVPIGDSQGPFHVRVELWYQPIGFRWAHNLAPYKAFEPQRFVNYYDSMASGAAVMLANAEATR